MSKLHLLRFDWCVCPLISERQRCVLRTPPADNIDQVFGVTMFSETSLTSVLIVLEAQTLIRSVFTGASREAAAQCEAICIIITER